MSDPQAFAFNFGPVSRTVGKNKESVAFAPLPLHEALTALLAARNREEFIAWLFHDSFKALFTWPQDPKNPTKFSWEHLRPKDGSVERLARAAQIRPELVSTHHKDDSKRAVLFEGDTICDEFDQLYLGRKAQFVQLSFRCQPSANTALLRLVILEAFLQQLSAIVGREIAGLGLPFQRVNYVFCKENHPLTEAELAAQYDLTIGNGEMTVTHYTPSAHFQEQTVAVDLTGTPPDVNQPQTLALSELLTIYRDDLTIIAALPLFAKTAPQDIVREIQAGMPGGVKDLLIALEIAPTHKWAIGDLVAFTLSEQVEIRLLDDSANESPVVVRKGRLPRSPGKVVSKLLARPQELMAERHLASRCAACGSPIAGADGRYLKPGKTSPEDIFSGHFTDFEQMGHEPDICPMCLIYANYKNKRLMRGSLAFLSPATSLHAPSVHTFVRPRFDYAGRFDVAKGMVKSAVTLQELVLLNMMSRRIIDQLIPFQRAVGPGAVTDLIMAKPAQGKTTIDTVVGKHLPYSGAYLVFDIAAVNRLYRGMFLETEDTAPAQPSVWQTVDLIAYPFEIKLSPSFSMLLELRVNDDFMNHAGSHTLLKLTPTTVCLSPEFSCHVLVDNSLQETVSKGYVDSVHLISQLANTPGIERHDFIAAVLAGDDPLTAAYEAAEAPRREKRRRGGEREFDPKIAAAERVFAQEVAADSLEEMWTRYQKLADRMAAAAQAHATLIHFMPKPKKGG
jgi:hypothetical protein